jgi:hypothetical protein
MSIKAAIVGAISIVTSLCVSEETETCSHGKAAEADRFTGTGWIHRAPSIG